jgi:hypothetical protein
MRGGCCAKAAGRNPGTGRMSGSMDRYNLALLLLAVAAIPLSLVSIWLGLAALVAVYGLLARLANRDFDG